MGIVADLLNNTTGNEAEQPAIQESAPVRDSSDQLGQFIDAYLPAAQRKAKSLGVSPISILAQAALETGYGKSVIPGSNNLFNIKDFSGAGVEASDNMTGSRDKYRAYESPDASFDDHAALIARRYKGALNTGDDVQSYFGALKAGGYAEDKDYVKKGVKVADAIRARVGNIKAETGEDTTSRMPDPRSMIGNDYVAPVPEESMAGAFVRNAKKTLPQTKQLLSGAGALVADSVGLDGVRDSLMKSYESGEKAVQDITRPTDTWSEAGSDNIGKFVAGSTGYFVGQIIESLAVGFAAGGVGSAAGGAGAIPASIGGILLKTETKAAIKTATEALIEAQIKKSLASGTSKEVAESAAKTVGADFAKTLAAKAAGKEIGIGGAMIAQGAGMETGEIYGHLFTEAKKEGREVTDEERGNAWLYGLLAGGVEGIIDKYNFDAVMGGGAKGAGLKQRIMGVLRGSAKAEAREVPTEIAQTGLERAGKGQEWRPSDPEALKEYGDTAAMTAAGAWVPGLGGARVDTTPAPAEKKPNSPLTNAANAAAAAFVPTATPSAPDAPVDTSGSQFGSPELDKKHAEIAAFMAGKGNLEGLASIDSALPDEASHVWNNVINNPDVALKTRINALNQGYAMLVDRPNFTAGGNQEQARQNIPKLGVDNSIDGEASRVEQPMLPSARKVALMAKYKAMAAPEAAPVAVPQEQVQKVAETQPVQESAPEAAAPTTSSLRAYDRETAVRMAAGLSKKDMPTEAYPHPTEAGKYALRIPAEVISRPDPVKAEAALPPVVAANVPATAPAKVKKAGRAINKAIDPERDSLFMAIAKLGGINTNDVISGWGHDPKDFRNGRMMGYGLRAVSSKGMSADGVLESLKQYGYFGQEATLAELESAFREEAGGNLHFTPEGYQFGATANAEAQYQEVVASGEITADTGVESFPEAIQEALEAEAEAYSSLDIEFNEEVDTSHAAQIAGMRALGFTEQEINDELGKGSSSTQSANSGNPAQTAAGATDESTPRGAGNGFALAQESNSRVTAGTDPESITKEQADKERDAVPFTLDTQSQPKPVGVQGGMFTADGRVSADAKVEGAAPVDAKADEMAALKAEMGQAIGELASILGVKANMTPEEETRILPVMSKIFRIAAKMGYITFKDAAVHVVKQLRELGGKELAEKISIDNLQSGYINIAKEIGGNKKQALEFESLDELMAGHDELVESIASAEKKTDSNPSDAQKEAENYRKGKFDWNGLTVAVETAKGTERSGKGSYGEEWRVTMPDTYGYFLGTKGADKDHVDVFVGEHPESNRVYIIDQNTPNSKIFDEHKVMIGFRSAEEAQVSYLLSFSGDFGGRVFGGISDTITPDQLKAVLPTLAKKAPYTPGTSITTRRERVDGEGTHTVVTLLDGTVKRISRMDSGSTMGLPGWHDHEGGLHSYLGDNQDEAINELHRRNVASATSGGVPSTKPAVGIEEFNIVEGETDTPKAKPALTKVVDNTAIPEPSNWRKNYGVASRYAEALGVPLRNENKKMLKVVELVAAIEAKLAGANEKDSRLPADATVSVNKATGHRAHYAKFVVTIASNEPGIGGFLAVDDTGNTEAEAKDKAIRNFLAAMDNRKKHSPSANSALEKTESKAATNQEVSSETARKGDYTLKSGEKARVLEQAERGRFSVSVGDKSGGNMESSGVFSMDDQGTVTKVSARAQWAMANVTDAAEQFSSEHRAPVSSLFSSAPDGRNSPKMEALDGFKVGDQVDVPNRTIDRSTVELLYKRNTVGIEMNVARIVSPQGKRLDVITSELIKVEAPASNVSEDVKQSPKVVEASSFDHLREILEAGDKAHYDYAGTDGRTVWVERTETNGWVAAYKDDDSRVVMTTGGSPYAGGFSKQEATKKALSDAEYRFNEWKPLAESAPSPVAEEPNYAAAKALMAEQIRATGNARAEAGVRLKARTLAGKTPISDEKTVLALDIVSTRLGMGDAGKKALDFLPAETKLSLDTHSISDDTVLKERNNEQTGNGGNGQESLATVSPGLVQGTEGKRDAGQGGGSLGRLDADGNGRSDEIIRDDQHRSVDGKPESVLSERPAETVEISGETRPLEEVAESVKHDNPASEPKGAVLTGANPGNYVITDDDQIGSGTTGQRIRSNMEAIRLVLSLERDQRYATPEEQAVLVKYVGWGGLKNVFKPSTDSKQEREAFAELKSLLTEQQLFWMGQSVLDAHYTSPKIIKSMYKILRHFGVTGGRFLEPTVGSGNFIGMMPPDMAASSKWHASEIDPITSLIAKHAYPDAQILSSTGFQEAEFSYGRFDVAIGNPPFGDQTITDTNPKRAEINGQKIHNYIISKSGMHLRPGGMMAMVVTSRFLDTANPEARGFLAKNFRFLGALRLPNNAFKENAGTEVTTDIIFLQKLRDGQRDGIDTWLDTNGRMLNEDGETVTLNRYFAENPERMLGKPSMQGTLYGSRTEKGEFTLQAIDGLDAEAKIDELIAGDWAGFKGIARKRPEDADAQASEVVMNREDVPIGGFFREGGRVLERVDDDDRGNSSYRELTPETPWTAKMALGKKRLDRIKGILDLRDDAYNLMYMERIDKPTDQLDTLRAALNAKYDAFVSEFGFLNSQENVRLFSDDARIEFGLESNFRKAISAATAKKTGHSASPETATKSALLVERVFFPTIEIDHADNPRDGYSVSLSQRGKLDLDYIAELTNLTRQDVIDDLSSGDKPLIFKNPHNGQWVQEDEYLSGNVKAKLSEAKAAGAEANVRALEAVQPKDVPAEEVHAEFGATWIPKVVYEDFLKLLGYSSASVLVLKKTGQVEVAGVGSRVASEFAADLENRDFGIDSIFSHVANRRPLVAYDGKAKERVVNVERTDALKRISKKLIAIWSDWVKSDDSRAALLAKEYNEQMNTTVERAFDGVTHLRTVGANPTIQLRNSQKNSAWRMVQSPVILMDHVVGAGKTIALITGLMERARLGLSRKPMVVVPNHLVGQWSRDWMQLYPGANILAATEKDFSKANRRRLFARIATGKYDAVIVGHSSFGHIPVDADAEETFLMSEVEHLQAALYEAEHAAGDGKKSNRTVRAIKNRIAKRLEKIKELQSKPRDNVATFEDMGIDYLAVDESHEFKNLEYSTTLSNIAGMGSPEGSKKAFDLYMKSQLITQRDGGIAFATGTPLSNSMVEMYTILRYLNRGALEDRNLVQFDSWAKTFASIESRDEYTATGKIKARTVMAAFNNLPELLQIYKQVADTVTMTDLKRIYADQMRVENAKNGTKKREDFPVPKVKDGGRRLDMGDPTPYQIEFMDYLMARADVMDKLKGREKQEYAKIDNALWLMNDARKMSLDVRTSDPSAPDEPGNKVNRAAKNIKEIYDRTSKDSGTQLVFCDLSTPAKVATKAAIDFIKLALKKLGLENDYATSVALEGKTYQEQWSVLAGRADSMLDSERTEDSDRERIEEFIEQVTDEDIGGLITADSGFSVYDALKEKLIESGIPEREIAFIHDAGTSEKKRELFGLVNAGKVRVLVGSSPKMGAGTNAQERVVALHHMDAPWRPSDMEQREGRVIRQGNKLYLRNPDGFYVEIIAYSTARTFDAQMWAVLARKAGFLEQFRMGLRSIKEDGGDAAGYAEFMAEATGNPIFREKIVREREIEELEAEDRSSKMKLSAARRAIETADARREGYLEEIDRVKDIAGSPITSVTFEGKTFANDLAEVLESEHELYQQEIEAYKVVHEAYVAERAEWEAKGTGSDRGRAPAVPHKPEYPETTAARVRDKSEWAKLIGELVMRMSVVSKENGGRRFTLTTQDGYPIKLEAGTTWNSGEVELSIDGVGHVTQGAPLGSRIPQALRANYLRSTFQSAQKDAERSLAALSLSVEQAKLTLERIKPIAQETIAAARAKYESVVKQVDEIAAQLSAERAGKENRYINRDAIRFPNGMADASDLPVFDPNHSQLGTLKELWAPVFGDSREAGPNDDRYFHLTKGNIQWFGHPVNGFSTKEEAQAWATNELARQSVKPSVLRKSARPDVSEFPSGIDAPTADAIAARLIIALGATTNHKAVDSFFNLPQEVQADARAQGSDEKTTKGVLHDGTVYIVARNIESIKDIEETVFHEVLGHVGMRKLLGPEFVQKMNALFAQLGGVVGLSRIAAENGFGSIFAEYVQGIASARGENSQRFTEAISKFIMTEEVFAHMAEKQPTTLSKAKALIGWVRDWLRKHGFATLAKYGETDILHLLNGARAALRGPDGNGPKGGMTPSVLARSQTNESGLDFANDFLTELSYEDEAFRYQISKSRTLEGNILEALPGAEYIGEDTRPDEREESMADNRYVFAMPQEGRIFYVYARDNRVWIDVSRLQPGDGGSAVYHGVANYAYNTGRVFVGDPQGLSEDAIIRRTSAMLSAALRFGTTAHIDAANEQIKGVPEKGIEPLEWEGDDVAKTKALIHTYITTLQTQHPDIKNYRYDFRNNKFVRNSNDVHGLSGLGGGAALGQAVGGMDGSREGRKPGATRAGEASLRRGILIQSLISSDSSEKPGLLENVLSRSSQLVKSKESLAAVLRRSPIKAANDFYTQRETSIADNSGRNYTAEQRTMFSNVGRETTKESLQDRLKSLWKDAGKKMAQGLVDQFAPIKEISNDAYTLLRLSKGAAGAFEAMLHYGKLKIDKDGVYDGDNSGGVIDKVFAPIGNETGDFMWWVAANRAEHLSQEDRENLFTEEDIDAGKTLADGETSFDYTLKNGPKAGKTTRNRAEVYADTLISFNEFHANAMDMAEQSGLIDGEARKHWENEFYIPFYRATDDEGGFKGANIKGGSVRQTAFKRLKGGGDKLNSDLLANTLQNWAHLIDASAKNRAAKASLEAAVAVGAAHYVPSASQIPTGSKNHVWIMGQNVRKIPKGTTYQEGGVTKVSDGTAEISEHGQVHYMVSDPFILTALTSLEFAGFRGHVMDAMTTMKHWLTVGVTASPAFKVRNLIRDSLQAIGTADLGYNPLANIKQGYLASDKKSAGYVSMLASGALIRFGTMMEGKESDRVRQLIKSGVEGHTILDSEAKYKAFYDKFIEPAVMAYNELGNRSEEITRAALYQQLIAQGKSHAYAALMARDLMDFSMQGSWSGIRFLTQIVPFMNARMQGLYKLGRAAHEDPRRFGIVLGSVALTSIALMAAYNDDDDWKKREDWDRDSYWWFKIGGTAFRIPKPFEIGAMATLAERGVELFTNDEMTRQRFLSRVFSVAADSLAMNPIPQAFKPIIDVYANKDSFSGRPIETMGMDRLKSEYRYTSHSSLPARAISTATNTVTGVFGKEAFSPVQIDHMIKGYFGWLGTFIVGGVDSMSRSMSDEPSRPSRDMFKFATQGFVSELEGAPSRYVSQMYEQAKILEQAHATHSDLLKRGRTAEAAEFSNNNADELRRYKQIEKTKQAEAVLNRVIRNIENNPNLDPEEKKIRIRAYQVKKDMAARKVAAGL